VTTYEELHKLSVEKPEEFWAAEAEKLHWHKRWDAVLDSSRAPFFRWFVGGTTNLCYNAVDRHVLAGKKYLPALIWESPETAESKIINFGQLHVDVNRFAGVMRRFGVVKDERVPPNTRGFLVIKPPLPPGALTSIWGSDAEYINAYWSGPGAPEKQLYFTGDYALEDEDGYFFLLGRADEVIHVAGQRLGTREVEEILSGHDAIAEVSAVGVKNSLKGEVVAAFVVLKQKAAAEDRVQAELRKLAREKLGEAAVPQILRVVRALPKTRSGKVLRRVLKAICENTPLGDLSGLEDSATIEEIENAVKAMGLKKSK